MNKLEKLPRKKNRYSTTNGEIRKLPYEKDETALYIHNNSGGVSLKDIHLKIPIIKKQHYKVLNISVGGDAPKDFINLYEYSNENDTKNWNKYIAKVGHKWYPLESISEHFLNRIGEVLDLNMAQSQLRLAHGQIRFLSKYFLKKDENLIHGAQIYSGYLLENDDRFVREIENNNWARTLLTFQFTDEAVKFMFPDQHEQIMNHLVELLVFDAITGNNDRHFYNWAVITDLKGKRLPKFSPIYDSARGLLWNNKEIFIESKYFIEDENGKIIIKQEKLETYLQSSRPKIGWEGWTEEKEINHFELIALINENYPQYKKICKRLINPLYLQSILKLLNDEFITFYSPLRYWLITECIKKRFAELEKQCKLC